MTSLQQICEKLPPTMHVLIWVCVLAWEYVIGKTKFGSTLQMFVEKPLLKFLEIANLKAKKEDEPK